MTMPATWHAHLARQIASPDGWEDAPKEAQPDRRIRTLEVEPDALGFHEVINPVGCVNVADFCGAPAGHLRLGFFHANRGEVDRLSFLQCSHPWNFLPDGPYELADFGEIPT